MRGIWAIPALLSAAVVAGMQMPAVLHGSVQATVLDANELPVPDVLVEALPQGVALAGPVAHCRTDERGICTIALHQAGSYAILASKEQDGYPKPYPFYRGIGAEPLPVAEISAQHATAAVVTHLGKRGGVVQGTVKDAVSGKPLDAQVEFRWVNEPANLWGGSGLTNRSFRILVPAEAAITMVVTMDGYEPWRYALGRGDLKGAIVLKPGEELTLDIRLWPKK
jgi:hypothetical protein